MEEIWKDIKGFEGKYQISNLGRLKSLKRTISVKSSQGCRTIEGCFLKSERNRYGYIYYTLCCEGIPNKKTVHRLLAEHFIPNPENKPQVNHINGIKFDNRLENLEWVTASENAIHSRDVLKYKRSEESKRKTRIANSKELLDINTGVIWTSIKEYAKHVGISGTQISAQLNGKYPLKYPIKFAAR